MGCEENPKPNWVALEELIQGIEKRVRDIEGLLRQLYVELIPAIYMKADLQSYMQEAQEIVALARAKGVPLGEMIEDLESKGKLPPTMAKFTRFAKGLRKVLQE